MKKLLSLILICSMVLSLFTISTFAYTDVSGDEMTRATGILKELGIMYGYEGDVFMPDELITRAEFAVTTARMINVSEKDETGVDYYLDIPDLHFALGAINNLTQIGVLAGDPTGHFRPDDTITAAEAYKMMLCIIGYGEYLDYKGGWPVGCMNLANQTDISIGVSADKTLTRGEVALLAVNTLEAPCLEAVSYGSEGIEYKVNEDSNLLAQYRDVYKAEGQVTAVPGTTLVEETEYTENEIYVDGVLYKYDGDDIKDLIGSMVEVYYYQKDGKGDREVVFIAEISEDINEIVISSENIGSFNEGDYVLKYFDENGKTRNASIAKNVSVIRNNVAITNLTKETFEIKNGSVKLKSTTGRSTYNVVIIQDYKNFVVGMPNVSDEIAYNYFKPTEPIDLNHDSVRLLNSSGVEISIEDLKAKNVLSVMNGSDNYSEIYVSNTLLSGKVDKIISDGDTIYTIGGNTYEVDRDLMEKTQVKVNVGDNIKYVLDIFGKIAYYEVARELEFGYLTNTSSSMFGDLTVKIFCSNGSFGEFECAEAVKFNNSLCTDLSVIEKSLKGSDGNTAPQLVRYKLNEKGELVLLETVSEIEKEEGLQPHKMKKPRGWKIAGYFAQDIFINKDTLIFSVPANPKGAKEDDYAMLAMGSLSEAITYDVASYKTKEKVGFEEVVVIWNDDASSTVIGDTYVMVESIGTMMNDDEEVVEYMSAYNGTSLTQYIAKEGFSIAAKGVAPGDIVRPALNTKNELINFELTYDWDSGERPSFITQTADFHAMNRVMFGYASDLVDNVFKLSYYQDGADTYRYNIEKTVVVVFDQNEREGQQIYPGTINDIVMYSNSPSTCSRFVLQSRYEQAKTIYVYK